MSEDRPPDDASDAPAPSSSPASDATPPESPAAGDATAAAPDRRRGRRHLRLAVLSVLLIATVIAAIALHRGRTRDPDATLPRGGSGAAIRAPEGPRVPLPPQDGAHLTGFVIDGAGTPVVGAEVSAELETDAAERAQPGDVVPPRTPTIWPTITGTPRDAGVGAGVFVGTPTGADGQFSIGGLEPGRYRLRVTGEGLLPAEVRYVPVPSDATRIVVARRVAIEGTVVDGVRAVPSVTIGLRGDAIGGTIETRSDPRGAFRFPDLPEGRYQLYAWQGSLAARAVRVTRTGVGPFAPVELRLEAASIVVGRVIDRDEGTGVIAAIELRPATDDEAPRYVRSGDDGTFRIEGVPNGRWIADAFAPGYVSPGGVELEAGRGIPELVLARGAMIEGQVLDGGGRPVAGASVRALGAGTTPVEQSEAIDQDKLRRFSGRTSAPTPAAGGVAGDPQLIARGELGVLVGPIPPIPPPGAQVARPAILDPSVATLAGEPEPLPVDPSRASIWTTGSDGRFRIRGLAKGAFAALAVAPGYAEGRSREVALDPGQLVTGVDIVLAPGTFLIGKVTDQHGVPIVGALISARPAVGAQLDTFTDDAGEYRVGPVTGKLTLFASAYGHGEARRELDVPVTRGLDAATLREDLVLVVADATLAGVLDDANGTPVSGAQIEVIGGAGEGRRALVASDGTFSIEMLPAGPLRVRVRHPDYPPRELDTVATTGATQTVRLRLPLGGALEGAVIDGTSGAPLTGITITARGPGGATAEATTDKAGLWRLGRLEPGRWKLAVKLPGFLPFTREVDVDATRTPGATSLRDVRLDLERGGLVGGTVRDDRGQRLAAATVTVRLANGTGPAIEGATDTVGEFRIRDVPTGELEVTATKGALQGSTRVTLRPGSEVLGLSIDVE